MADLHWCSRCGALIYSWTDSPHACPPTWAVWVPEDGEDETDARNVFGSDPEDAAERHVKGFDCDYTKQLLGSGYLVSVRDGDKVVRVRVRGEATIDYSAETEEDDDG